MKTPAHASRQAGRRRLFLISFLLSPTLTPAQGVSSERPNSTVAGTRTADPAQTTGTITGRVQNVATGQYLNMARVSLKGTNQVVYTDNFGSFTLRAVPAGPAVVEVFYTDLDPAQIPVTMSPGGTIEQAVDLTSLARYGQTANTVKLDPFLVSSERETDAQAIATNEQRFAPNIKNVMSTDSLGDVLGGSVGEFVKFIPGVTVEYDFVDVAGLSIRGIGGGMTSITTNGAPASNIWVGATRSVDLRSMALNDISRIEVTKVPTPASPADSLAGSVNMVSKSAFERKGRQLSYGLNLVGNSGNIMLKKSPHAYMDRDAYKVLPGANFDFTWPITKTFGLVIAGMSTNVFAEQHRSFTTWSNTGTGTNASTASPSNPFLLQHDLFSVPRNLTRNSLSLKADWKVTRHSVLSLGHTANRALTEIGLGINIFNVGTIGTPAVAGGVPMTWDATSTRGATGQGTLTTRGMSQKLPQITDTTTLTYRYDDGRWKLEAGLSRSASKMLRLYEDAGFFLNAFAANNRPVRINFLNIDTEKPGLIEVFDNNDQPFEWRDLRNYRGTQANSATTRISNKLTNGYLNLRRTLSFLPVPAALQVGGSQRELKLDMRPQSMVWTFNGPGGNSAATAPLAPYAAQVYTKRDSHYGVSGMEWLSAMRAYQAWQLDPRLYSMTPAQAFNAENFRIDNSEYIKETIQAAYVQAEADFFRNRLRVLGGVRFEKTTDRGQGGLNDADAVWQRDAKGNYLRTPAGARIRKPEAGAVNSLAQLQLTRRERGALSNRTYDGYYPSLHFTFNATENLLVRAAYASTYGRPDLSDVIPRTVAIPADLDDDDPTPTSGRGTLTMRNAALKPWSADNYDLSVEYYTRQGGTLSAGVFLKEIRDFFGTSARIVAAADLAALELDEQFLAWNVTTKFNSGDAQIKGAEFNLRHSLRVLGRWGSYFTLFGNATKLELSGNPGASFTSFIPLSGNWGATFTRKRISLTARWNYRGLDKRGPQANFGPDGYEYVQARTTLDMNGSYQLARRLSLNASVGNLQNESQTVLRYGSSTPAHARQYSRAKFGIQIAVGIKGTF